MKTNLKPICILLFVAAIIFSCSDKEEPPLPAISIKSNNTEVLSHDKAKLSAVITNFRIADVIDCGFKINGTLYSIGVPTSDNIEYIAESLDGLSAYYYRAYVVVKTQLGSQMKEGSEKEFETLAPPVVAFDPMVVSDLSQVKIQGSGFNDKTFFYLEAKRSITSAPERFNLTQLQRTNTEITVQMPLLGGRGKESPMFFTEAIQPLILYISNNSKTIFRKIGELNFRYRFFINQSSGSSTSDFQITIFYARQTPPIENIEVYFGDTKRAILEKFYLFDIVTTGEMIEGYRIKCSVPFGSVAGTKYKIRVVSPFGEEFIASGNNEFTVN